MENFDRIDKYLKNLDSKKERKEFEQELDTNKVLEEEFKLQRFEESALQLMAEDRLKARITSIQQQAKKKSPLTVRRNLIGLSTAAAILLIITLFMFNPPISSRQLALSNYTFEPTNLQRGDIEKSVFSEGLAFLEEERYSEAVDYFLGIQKNTDGEIAATYYLGHAYFQKGDYSTALIQFKATIDLGVSALPYSREARWYALLAQLAMADTDSSFLSELNKLSDEGDPRAQRLLDRLERFPYRLFNK